MYKLEIELKQHTPLIHFQWYQDGATLRASEVKPKLDKFLIKILGGKEKINKKFFKDPQRAKSDKNYHALNYKLTIINNDAPSYYVPLANSLNSKNYQQRENNFKAFIKDRKGITPIFINNTPYFANSDKIHFINDNIDKNETQLEKIKLGLFFQNYTKIIFISPNKDLIDLIKSKINIFFFLTNFGARTSKGFGSFTLQQIDGETANLSFLKDLLEKNKKLLENLELESIYEMNETINSHSEALQKINEIWKELKSGINFQKYKKSDLFNYFYHNKPQIRWEKRAIKLALKNNYLRIFQNLKSQGPGNLEILAEDNGEVSNNDFYVRALLGFTENFQFALNNGQRINIIVKDKMGKDKCKEEYQLERYQSPVTFRYINNSLFMIIYKINPELHTVTYTNQDREFEFTYNNNVLVTLKIPKDFSVTNFLDSPKYNSNNQSIAQYYRFKKINI